MAGLPLTGERTVPGLPEENYWFRRHERAYLLAAQLTGGRVLDAGCGEGYGAALLAGSGDVVALELDDATAAHARRRYPKVQVVQGDACRLPFRPGSLDAVVALQVLEHLICADRFVSRARDLLRPGGRLILSTPNRLTFSPSGRVNPFHVYEYTAEELEGLLRVHFSNVRVRGIRSGPTLRVLDVLSGGSFQHRLMRTPYGELPGRVRRPLGRLQARHFRVGRAKGSLDLLAVAS